MLNLKGTFLMVIAVDWLTSALKVLDLRWGAVLDLKGSTFDLGGRYFCFSY